jgi:micrococcal nuclease
MTTSLSRLLIIATTALLAGCAASSSAPPPPGVSFPTGQEAPAAVRGELLAPADSANAPLGERDVVERVVDGDTVVLGRLGTVRLVGIDTPETKKPNTPVQCHGPEASRAAEDTLTGRNVILEPDRVAGTFDRYDRRLGYLWYLADGQWNLYNLEAIEAGHARSYAYDDQLYERRGDFEAAESRARDAVVGLWRCPGS